MQVYIEESYEEEEISSSVDLHQSESFSISHQQQFNEALEIPAKILDLFFDFFKVLNNSNSFLFLTHFQYFYQQNSFFATFLRENLAIPLNSLKAFILTFINAFILIYFANINYHDKIGPFLVSYAFQSIFPGLYLIYKKSVLGIMSLQVVFRSLITDIYIGEQEMVTRILFLCIFLSLFTKNKSLCFVIIFIFEIIDCTIDFQGGNQGGFYNQTLQFIFQDIIDSIINGYEGK